MQFFVDSVDLADIRKAKALGLADGVTTNPTLVAKAGRSHREMIREILKEVDGPVCVEPVSLAADEIVREGNEFLQWGRSVKREKNVHVKIPICREGLAAVRRFSDKGIPTAVTLVFTVAQALAAAKAGASYIFPFVGRLDDSGANGIDLVRRIAATYLETGLATKVLVASVRSVEHIVGAAAAGAHGVTIPAKLIEPMLQHPLTDKGIAQFLEDAKKFR